MLGSPSSDLFVFSGDDPFPTMDSYTHQQPKRQRQGTLWTLPKEFTPAATAAIPVKQRQTSRSDYVRGVWMGSDSSLGDDALLGLVDEDAKRNKVFKIVQIEDDMIRRFDPRAVGLSDPQWEALKQVDQAVLNHSSIINFTSLSLKSLPWVVLQSLENLRSAPDDFVGLSKPSYRMYLTQNGLSSLPEELFNLKGMITLGLRGNNLTELSPAISQLIPYLDELNLSSNRLNYLPMEMKDGFDPWLCSPVLRLTNNPFYQPVQSTEEDTSTADEKVGGRSVSTRMPNRPHSTHCTRIAYMSTSGVSINGPVPSRDREASPVIDTELKKLPLKKLPKVTSKVPSLYEIAMRKSTEHPITALLESLGDEVPQRLVSNLKKAAEQAKTGFPSCSICKRKFSIARTEWIEWRSKVEFYQNIPLLYRGCSWSCLPETGHLDHDAKNCGWTVGEGLKEWDPFIGIELRTNI